MIVNFVLNMELQREIICQMKGSRISQIKEFVKVTVKVSPKKASLASTKVSRGKKLAVKWAKDKNASGYQVQISTSKNFKKNMKQKNLSKTSYTFTKLKAGRKGTQLQEIWQRDAVWRMEQPKAEQ